MSASRGSALDEPHVTGGNSKSQMESQENHLFAYQFTPTPCEPLRMERFRLENIFMCFASVCGFAFAIASLNTPISRLKTPELEITIDGWMVHGCLQSNCGSYFLWLRLCDEIAANASLFVGLAATHVVAMFVNIVFSGFLVFGRVGVSKYMVVVLAFVSMLLVFMAGMGALSVHASPLCHNRSLQSMGFKSGPALPLLLTDFLLLLVAFVFYIIRRYCRPPRYHF
ncbi:hypothetical protein DQ04_00411170 [Trypanosoma grayi]|uniref:hypothetical protein n=1 Tax=Trypanosoma grayi TaxID=71804 RepID=UPI0004F4AEF8|nr:hypothetical protein DQ04_00411170 [Trypanosoma grayi]KEG14553.1 hypothetical protein DQ04_00411170 [Trypanosoma grayi]